MKLKDSQFVGAAGTYYVMARLASMQIHASVTFGNAPYVDILACSPTGEKQIAIQVKTADYAKRSTGRGNDKKWDKLDWALSFKAATSAKPNLFFAFVDLWGDRKSTSDVWQPTVYIIPSVKLSEEICKDWRVGAWRLQIEAHHFDEYKEKWNLVEEALKEQITDATVSEVISMPLNV